MEQYQVRWMAAGYVWFICGGWTRALLRSLARDAWERVPWGEDEGRGAAPSPREGTSSLSKPIQRRVDAGIATLARDAWEKVP